MPKASRSHPFRDRISFGTNDFRDPPDGFHAILAGVVGRARRPQRQVALGREQQDHEGGGQAEIGVEQAQTDV
ncbi:MAG TPA: hypothetical protein VH333_08140, partial [Pseudonocardiaceae bacterium]|nr:hypothetical protein [Pseudonocardiaceae bacterium]